MFLRIQKRPKVMQMLTQSMQNREEICKSNVDVLEKINSKLSLKEPYGLRDNFLSLPDAESAEEKTLLKCRFCAWYSSADIAWTKRIQAQCESCLEKFYTAEERALRTQAKNLLEGMKLLRKLEDMKQRHKFKIPEGIRWF